MTPFHPIWPKPLTKDHALAESPFIVLFESLPASHLAKASVAKRGAAEEFAGGALT